MTQNEIRKLLDRGRLVEMIERHGSDWVKEALASITTEAKQTKLNTEKYIWG
jgi:hypothetical protein